MKASNSTVAWEKLNRLFIKGTHKRVIFKGHSQYVYDFVLHIENPKMDPELDIFKFFHYSISKWSQLINNYLDIPYLKEFKRSLGDKKEFNKVYYFSNSHSNGKNCLLTMVCSQRVDKSLCLTLFLRASEITKRLFIDLVFFQRIGEYLFEGKPFHLVIHFNYVFQDDPVLLMYLVHDKSILNWLLENKNKGNRYKYLLDQYNRLKSAKNLGEIKYKIYRRILKVINPKIDTSKKIPLKVRDLRLENYIND